ncbi:MAG: hypothetical protein HY315_05640 [Acidobacteria bacterium]|nr:hypothetical protein [Acidobacteriota bacterium]
MLVRKGLAFWSCFFCVAAVGWAHEGELSKDILKKFFPEAENFVSRQKSLSSQAIQKVEQALGGKVQDVDKNLTVYVAISKDPQTSKTRSIGGVLMVDTNGTLGPIDLAVGYALDGTVKKVVILKNQDEKGLESAAFLKQLEGRGLSGGWDPQKDFNLAGNPASAREVILAVRRGMLLFRAFVNP